MDLSCADFILEQQQTWRQANEIEGIHDQKEPIANFNEKNESLKETMKETKVEMRSRVHILRVSWILLR